MSKTRTPVLCVLTLCSFLFPVMLSAEEPAVTISTDFRTGAFFGMGREFVYNQNPALPANYKNSELDWPMMPMIFAGGTLSLDTAVGFFATLDVRQGFSGKAGTMTDSDFLNGDGVRTHYSQSDSWAERANLLDLRAGWRFVKSAGFTFGAFGAFSYMDLKWSARDGYYQYPTSGSPYSISSSGTLIPGSYTPWSSSQTETPLYGTGIIYETTYVGGSIGVEAGYTLGSAFRIGASFAFTPLLFVWAEDNHVMRQLDFYSTLAGGLMIEPRLTVSWNVIARATLTLDVGYRYAWNLRGDLTEVATGTSDLSTNWPYIAGPDSAYTGTNDSGADLSLLDASITLRIVL